MAYDIDILNQALTDFGVIAGYKYTIDALNAICTYLGITAGYKYDIDAYNAIAVYQGKSGTSKYNIDALNLITEGAYKYESEALVLLGALVNQVDETLLADNIYLTTVEGYLMVEQDNKESFIISED